jgi:hypothetical protein
MAGDHIPRTRKAPVSGDSLQDLHPRNLKRREAIKIRKMIGTTVRCGLLRIIAVPSLVDPEQTTVLVKLDISLDRALWECVRSSLSEARPPPVSDVVDSRVVNYTRLRKAICVISHFDLQGSVKRDQFIWSTEAGLCSHKKKLCNSPGLFSRFLGSY